MARTVGIEEEFLLVATSSVDRLARVGEAVARGARERSDGQFEQDDA